MMAFMYRMKCPACGKVTDVAADGPCPACKQPMMIWRGGGVQVYRMGSPMGMAVGYGTYINGQPYGHIGNCESVYFPLPFGTYTFHFTCGMTRKCEDVTVTITPEQPFAFVKARIKMGFWANSIVAEQVSQQEMPPMQQ